jgi:hypothetical protein
LRRPHILTLAILTEGERVYNTVLSIWLPLHAYNISASANNVWANRETLMQPVANFMPPGVALLKILHNIIYYGRRGEIGPHRGHHLFQPAGLMPLIPTQSTTAQTILKFLHAVTATKPFLQCIHFNIIFWKLCVDRQQGFEGRGHYFWITLHFNYNIFKLNLSIHPTVCFSLTWFPLIFTILKLSFCVYSLPSLAVAVLGLLTWKNRQDRRDRTQVPSVLGYSSVDGSPDTPSRLDLSGGSPCLALWLERCHVVQPESETQTIEKHFP